jgi:hypothetical protein
MVFMEEPRNMSKVDDHSIINQSSIAVFKLKCWLESKNSIAND